MKHPPDQALRSANSVSSGSRSPAQRREGALDPTEAPRLAQRPRLGLHRLGRQDPPDAGERRIAPEDLEVARELVNRLDRADALDLVVATKLFSIADGLIQATPR